MIRYMPWTVAILAGPAVAQDAPAPAQPTAAQDEAEAIARALAIGSALFTLDHAAWVSTDALKAALPVERLSGAGGYVIEPAADRALTVTYYAGAGEAARVIFVASVRAGKVADSRVVTEATPLTDAQRRLARARDAALAEAVRRKYAPCTAAPFNIIVLPGQAGGGPSAVYLLSAQVKNGEYPLGGHYRVIIDADGKAVSARPYSVGCLNMAIPKLPAGATPAALFVNHLLDPVPTEIHVFSSFVARLPLLVGTRDTRQWSVSGGRIAAIERKR